MTDFKKVNDDLSIAGQISAEELRKLAIEGFKSVLNLRDPDENGFFHDEKQEAEIVGLEYVNIALNSQEPNKELTTQTILEIYNLPKPIQFS
jgi:protein tyrosine phosphatase (PTP) superfamily phosphohydrolase (DUF442 family)